MMEFKAKSFVANKTNLEQQAFDAIVYAQSITDSDKRVELIVMEYDNKRSRQACAQQHVWIQEIAKHTGESIPKVTADMKIQHGLPIILADPEHGPVIEWILKKYGFYGMRYERQLKLIEYVPVTRLFSTKQHNAYRDSLQVMGLGMGINIDYLT